MSSDNMIVTYLVLSALALFGCGGGGGGKVGKMKSVNLDVEPNSFNAPVELARLSSLTGTVSSDNDKEDVYLLTAPKSARYIFKLTGFGKHDLDLFVGDPEANFVVSASDDLIDGEVGSADLLKEAVYAIVVLGIETSGEPAKYLLEITEEPVAEPPAKAPAVADGGKEKSRSGLYPWMNLCYWTAPPGIGYYHCDLVPDYAAGPL